MLEEDRLTNSLGRAVVFADNVFNELLSNLSGIKRQPGNLPSQ